MGKAKLGKRKCGGDGGPHLDVEEVDTVARVAGQDLLAVGTELDRSDLVRPARVARRQARHHRLGRRRRRVAGVEPPPVHHVDDAVGRADGQLVRRRRVHRHRRQRTLVREQHVLQHRNGPRPSLQKVIRWKWSHLATVGRLAAAALEPHVEPAGRAVLADAQERVRLVVHRHHVVDGALVAGVHVLRRQIAPLQISKTRKEKSNSIIPPIVESKSACSPPHR